MADSRTASLKLITDIKRVVNIQSKIIYFLLSIIFSFALTYFLYESTMNMAQVYVLFVLFLAIGLWVTEAIPPFAVGLLVFGFLIFAMNDYYSQVDPSNVQAHYGEYINSWSSSVIWLLLGGFFMAEAMSKTQLDRAVFRLTISSFGTLPRNILLGMMLSTAIFSMIMSNTATTAMMIASVMPFIKSLDADSPFSKALLLGIAGAASLGGMGTIIGSPPNAIAVEALNNHGLEVGFLEWMIVGFPVALVLTFIFWLALTRRYFPKKKRMDIILEPEEKIDSEALYKIDRLKKRVVLGVLLITLILWLTENVHGIPASVVSLLPIILLTMSGIITGDDVRRLPWDTLMLVAGGLALGLAIKETGLAEFYMAKFDPSDLNFYILLLGFGFLTMILSNIMSNTATASVLIPISIILTYDQPIALPLVIGLCASTALFLPISTPPNAIAYSSGKVKQRDFAYGGMVMGILGPVLITMLVMILSKAL